MLQKHRRGYFTMSCHEIIPTSHRTLAELADADSKKAQMSSKLKKFLSDNNECYVLITCKKPSSEGKMEVEMTYEGNACLAAYLIESAHGLMDENEVVESYS
jgi:hypothetical protein